MLVLSKNLSIIPRITHRSVKFGTPLNAEHNAPNPVYSNMAQT